ncbi:MAG TPA: hypothetical protein ENN68_01645 [Methanomicrobia archaeon]|nr:hypothetical protein [Methanomicrobia archaeon]
MLNGMLTTVSAAEPQAAHHALAELEHPGKLRCITTQNIDGMHQRAVSSNVIEFHGCFRPCSILYRYAASAAAS